MNEDDKFFQSFEIKCGVIARCLSCQGITAFQWYRHPPELQDQPQISKKIPVSKQITLILTLGGVEHKHHQA